MLLLPSLMLTAADNTVTPSMGPFEMELLLKLMQRSFLVLNSTETSITSSCWFCRDTAPPYYEGIAVMGNYTLETDHDQGGWHSKASLTLPEVTGQRFCIGAVRNSTQALCNQTLASPTSQGNLIPLNDTWWVCASGFTPCGHTKVLNDSKGFCVLVQLVPGLLYLSTEELLNRLEGPVLGRVKREPVSTLTLSILLGASLGRLGVGTASIITQNQHYSSQCVAIGVEWLENSVFHLWESLTSLAEVVLQTRRGLDLIFLRQGGLLLH